MDDDVFVAGVGGCVPGAVGEVELNHGIHGIHGRNACSGVTTDDTDDTDDTDETQCGFVLRGIWGEPRNTRTTRKKLVWCEVECRGLTTDDTDDTDETQDGFVLRGIWGSGTTEYTEYTEKLMFGVVGGWGSGGWWNHERHERHEKTVWCGVECWGLTTDDTDDTDETHDGFVLRGIWGS